MNYLNKTFYYVSMQQAPSMRNYVKLHMFIITTVMMISSVIFVLPPERNVYSKYTREGPTNTTAIAPTHTTHLGKAPLVVLESKVREEEVLEKVFSV